MTKKKKKEKKPYIHPSEMADGDYESDVDLKLGGVQEMQIRSKTGDDGIEETHISYKKISEIRVGGLGERYDEIDWSE